MQSSSRLGSLAGRSSGRASASLGLPHSLTVERPLSAFEFGKSKDRHRCEAEVRTWSAAQGGLRSVAFAQLRAAVF